MPGTVGRDKNLSYLFLWSNPQNWCMYLKDNVPEELGFVFLAHIVNGAMIFHFNDTGVEVVDSSDELKDRERKSKERGTWFWREVIDRVLVMEKRGRERRKGKIRWENVREKMEQREGFMEQREVRGGRERRGYSCIRETEPMKYTYKKTDQWKLK